MCISLCPWWLFMPPFSAHTSELLGLCVTMVVGEEARTYNLSCKTSFEKQRTSHLIIHNCKPRITIETEINFNIPVHSSMRTHVWLPRRIELRTPSLLNCAYSVKSYNDASGDCYWECVWEISPGSRCCTCCTYMGTFSSTTPFQHNNVSFSILISINFTLSCKANTKNLTVYCIVWSTWK